MEDGHERLYVQCCEEKNELTIEPLLLEELDKYINKFGPRLKETARIKFLLSDHSFLQEIFSAPQRLLLDWAKNLNIDLPGFGTNRDLKDGFYEGGCKVWEATEDLIKFVNEDQEIIDAFLDANKKFKMLELGCGSGLVTLALLSRLIAKENFDSEYRIHVQDYNWEVLASLTILNFGLNLPLDYVKALIENRWLRFFYGDWSNIATGTIRIRYNLILTCETIYNSKNFHSFHDLLDKYLKRDGFIIIATKDNYFGLTGGLYSWLDYVASKNIFTPIKMSKIFPTNIPRSILIMRRIAFKTVSDDHYSMV